MTAAMSVPWSGAEGTGGAGVTAGVLGRIPVGEQKGIILWFTGHEHFTLG